MSKCLCCGFENSENCTFCAICGHPVEDDGFYVHRVTNKSDISVEELNNKLFSQSKKENQATKSFKKLDKTAIQKESAKIDDKSVKEYKGTRNKTAENIDNTTCSKTEKETNVTEEPKLKQPAIATNQVYKSQHLKEKASIKQQLKKDKAVVKTENIQNSSENVAGPVSENNFEKSTKETLEEQPKPQQASKPMVTDSSNSRVFEFLVKFLFGTKDITQEFDNDDIEENCILSVVSYIPFLFFVPMIIKPRSGYLRFHGTQGLTMFLVSLVLEFFNMLLNAIISSVLVNMVGSVLTILITVIINMYILLMISIGIANSVKGIAKELPIIGKYQLLKP